MPVLPSSPVWPWPHSSWGSAGIYPVTSWSASWGLWPGGEVLALSLPSAGPAPCGLCPGRHRGVFIPQDPTPMLDAGGVPLASPCPLWLQLPQQWGGIYSSMVTPLLCQHRPQSRGGGASHSLGAGVAVPGGEASAGCDVPAPGHRRDGDTAIAVKLFFPSFSLKGERGSYKRPKN